MRRLRKNFIRWTVVSLICLLLGFLLGKFKQDILRDSLALMAIDLNTIRAKKIELSKQVAALQASLMTDSQTIIQLTQENKKLNDELNLSANKLYFYERVVSPELASSGVKIYSFTVAKNLDTSQWHYELVFMQAQKGRRFLTGDFALTFSVFENEQLKNISSAALGDASQSSFKFKYFQTIKGAFSLPPEMTIDEVTLQINVMGNRWYKSQQLEQSYDWKTLTANDADNLTEFDNGNIIGLSGGNVTGVVNP